VIISEGREEMDEQMWTVKEVAERLKVSTVTIRTWIRDGKLRAKRIGRPWHVPDSAVREALESGLKKEDSPERE
jgi:excisionase family DNA binding protein